jgi:hypothetical protein
MVWPCKKMDRTKIQRRASELHQKKRHLCNDRTRWLSLGIRTHKNELRDTARYSKEGL